MIRRMAGPLGTRPSPRNGRLASRSHSFLEAAELSAQGSLEASRSPLAARVEIPRRPSALSLILVGRVPLPK